MTKGQWSSYGALTTFSQQNLGTALSLRNLGTTLLCHSNKNKSGYTCRQSHWSISGHCKLLLWLDGGIGSIYNILVTKQIYEFGLNTCRLYVDMFKMLSETRLVARLTHNFGVSDYFCISTEQKLYNMNE